ncbi:hypothetical protein FA15DRAFT_113239 [Coprinopsis marcescibilis]|uniref:Protein SQS1 n=1 Tax=Coprinopsis marcescibilis TaxID=230819 RepID=A0A5C3KKL9_COPMA|nr:hypothetical protein FA15DRAFT_113239 [Coprinopsis marcescibilis]
MFATGMHNNRGNSNPQTPSRGRGGRGGGGRGRGGPAGRGRGGPPQSSAPEPSYSSPRGRGRGIGSPQASRVPPKTHLNAQQPLSSLLYNTRPLLRPVSFVRSQFSRVLFVDDEEEVAEEIIEEVIAEPFVNDAGDDQEFISHAPTANQVLRVFSGTFDQMPSFVSGSEDEDALEEIDFSDLSKLAAQPVKDEDLSKKRASTQAVEEERFTGVYATPTTTTTATTVSIERTPSATSTIINAITIRAPDKPEDVGSSMEVVPEDPIVAPLDLAPPRFIIDTDPSPSQAHTEHIAKPRIRTPSPIAVDGAQDDDDDDEVIVYVAPHPRKSHRTETERQSAAPTRAAAFTPYQGLGLAGVAPATPARAATPPSIDSFSFSFSGGTPSNTLGTLPLPLSAMKRPSVATPRMNKAASAKEKKIMKRLKQKGRYSKGSGGGGGGMFGVLGAMMQEKELYEEYGREGDGVDGWKDPRWADRRKGDSDLEWGDEDGEDEDAGDGEGKAKAATAQEEANGVDMDVDVEFDLNAMKRFVGGLVGREAGMHVSAGDLEDEESMRMEDEDGLRGSDAGSSADSEEDSEEDEDEEDEQDLLEREEAMIVAEFDRVAELKDGEEAAFSLDGLSLDDEDDDEDDEDDDDDDEDDDDEEATPRTSFQARLEKLRQQSRARENGKGKGRAVDPEDDDYDDEEDDVVSRNLGWAIDADKLDDYDDGEAGLLAKVQEMLDENADILESRKKKKGNLLFQAIQDGYFDETEHLQPAKRGKKKRDSVPENLQATWDKDRAKKAQYKAQREAEKLGRALDPFSDKKGGKKGRKAMLAAARSDGPLTVIASSNRIIDMSTLIQMIRRFVADVGGKSTLSLPPTSKETRKNVHELAIAFGLKSVSKGHGEGRYVTLGKTTRTGVGRVDERKVERIVRRSGGAGDRGNDFYGGGGKGKGKGGGRGGGGGAMPRHQEGDQVGAKAPRIDASNIGFRMLEMMGWAEGQTIGGGAGGVGLENPLVAIVKNSKLGLGATR